ncbi:alpha/beta hydrolase [Thermomonospora umbrina]|uniref:Prolyl oligopeptidase family protein n=1 Tax=Thermomonospora umbrina TaxID=111806 RepID=A0A3D9SU68_9ACTN|nr:prolyl oligopeptidase family serine peptidase [Thermomonospora umbrina]REE97563.1 prolyl oligopeptidase family protein [Thermomonospora umbrina]
MEILNEVHATIAGERRSCHDPMSADRMTTPRTGTAADASYLALPPTAVDARPAGPTRLVVAWHGFGPPRTPPALASAMPMTGVPTWRVYLHLPAPEGALPPAGLGGDAAVEEYGDAVEAAAARFPEALAEIRGQLGLVEGPVGLTGFSAGATVAMLVLASGEVPVSAAAFVSPIIAPARTMSEVVKETGRTYAWSERSRAAADRLDLAARAGEIAGRGTPMLLVGGSRDRLVRAPELTRLRDRLAEHGADVELATFRMAHSLTEEPGVEALPPQAEAVSVDGALTDWFREHLAIVDVAPEPGDEPGDEDDTPVLGGRVLRPEEAPTGSPAESAAALDRTMPDGAWSSSPTQSPPPGRPAPQRRPEADGDDAHSPLTVGGGGQP